ncbi:MAG: FAD-binding protein [Spirosoma sp.]|nr:FAD-binding protein [Spirosoma sp.]
MSLPNGIRSLTISELTNKHQTFTQPLTPGASFKLTIPAGLPNGQAAYRQTTANFQWLIQHAQTNGLRLRAIGKNWSFTKVAVTNGGMVDTDALMQTFTLLDTMVAPDWLNAGNRADNLFFTECGTTIHILEQLLEARGKSILASGGSNGQTIAGATSTGTHGAAFDFGAVHDSIRGLHIVCGPDRHVWLERASQPVASTAFTNWLGVTEVLRDDALFNAAVVSFGSFGFIHGILLEVADLFWLKSYRSLSMRYTAGIRQAMTHCDFSTIDDGQEDEQKLNLPPETSDASRYHFQIIINPHQFDLTGADQQRGVYVRMLDKHRTRPPGNKPEAPAGFTYGDDTLGVIQKLLDNLPAGALIPPLVNFLYPQALDKETGWVGTLKDFFGSTNVRGKASSAAIGVDAQDSPQLLAEIMALNKQKAFPGLLGLRWVKRTPATLGFTRFPITCVLELDGVDSDRTNEFLTKVWNRLDQLGMTYTMHWGKVNFGLTPDRLRRMYGPDRVDAWRIARQQLLDAPTRAVFTNGFMEHLELDKTVVPLVPPPTNTPIIASP